MTNLTPNALTEGREITVTLPSGIPDPKFQLFQQVRCKSSHYTPPFGTIVGMEYVTLFVALALGYNTYGWCYSVDFFFGEPMEKALKCSDPTQEFSESELEETESELEKEEED